MMNPAKTEKRKPPPPIIPFSHGIKHSFVYELFNSYLYFNFLLFLTMLKLLKYNFIFFLKEIVNNRNNELQNFKNIK